MRPLLTPRADGYTIARGSAEDVAQHLAAVGYRRYTNPRVPGAVYMIERRGGGQAVIFTRRILLRGVALRVMAQLDELTKGTTA